MHQRLLYTPALDALRAIAVIGVLCYHHSPDLVPGGWLGVSMFFTLSGFLIAGVLLGEHEGSGKIDLRAFWVRRIRRLLPASVVAIGLALFVAARSADHRVAETVPDVQAAIMNVANWRFLVADAPYAGSEGAPSPVLHYWSLAIEEQFYVVLPLLVAVAFRRRLLAVAVAVVILGSLTLQLVLGGNLDRVYFGTDTRAAELAVGVGLAMALPGIRRLVGTRRWMADAWGASALVAAVVLFVAAELTTDFVGSGALTAVTIVWAGLLIGSVMGRRFPAVIARGPLPGLGRISYGVYLYHWPVYLLATSTRTGLEGLPLFVVRVGVTLALAVVSYELIEQPIRRGLVLRRRLLPAAFATIALIVAATAAIPSGSGTSGVLAADRLAAPPLAAMAPVDLDGTGGRVGAGVDRSALAVGDGASASVDTDGVPSVIGEAPAPRRPRLLVVGDSTAGATGTGLQEAAAADGVADVWVYDVAGCAALRYDVAMVRPGYEFRTECVDVFADAVELAADIDPDAVLVFLGSAQLMDARYPGLDDFRSILDGEVTDRYRSAVVAGVTRLGELGVPVLWADVPVPEWDLDAFGQLLGGPLPGSGEAVTNDPARTRRLNDLDREAMVGVSHAVVWPYAAALAGPDGVIDPGVRSDGLHVDPAEARRLARDVFLGLLEDAYRSVIVRPGTGLAPVEPTTWSAPRPAA